MTNVHVTSRTNAQDYLNCRRFRYWRTIYRGTGLEPIRSSIPLVVGSSVHAAIETIFGFCISDEPFDKFAAIESAVEAGLKYYDDECARRELDIGPDEEMPFVMQEQRAMIEGITRGWIYFILPQLLDEFSVVGVEREDIFKMAEWGVAECLECEGEGAISVPSVGDISAEDGWEVCQFCRGTGAERAELWWQSRADIDLQSKRTGELFVASLKNIKQYGSLEETRYRLDMQGNSEIYAAEQARQMSYAGVQMLINVKGAYKKPATKSDDSDEWVEQGPKTYQSFLVHPYMKQGITSDGDEFAFTNKYSCDVPHKMGNGKLCKGGANHRLGKEWAKVNIWEHLTMKEWIEMLASGRVQGAGNPFAQIMFLPSPHTRNKSAIDSWLRQITAQEVKIAQDSEVINSLEEGSPEYVEALDRDWQMNTDVCLKYGENYKCQYFQICHEGVSLPLDSGLYAIRRPHHDLEKQLFTERGIDV